MRNSKLAGAVNVALNRRLDGRSTNLRPCTLREKKQRVVRQSMLACTRSPPLLEPESKMWCNKRLSISFSETGTELRWLYRVSCISLLITLYPQSGLATQPQSPAGKCGSGTQVTGQHPGVLKKGNESFGADALGIYALRSERTVNF
jgi:hypothetical protein